MGFLRKIFGANASDSSVDDVRARLEELQRSAVTQRPKALRMLRKLGRCEYALLGLGGELHVDFQRVAALCLGGDAPPVSSVHELPWENWSRPTCGQLLETALGIEADLLFLRADSRRRVNDAVAEFEVLGLFDENRTVLMIYGEEEAFVRRSFLRAAESVVDSESEEILQDLIDAAGTLNLECGNYCV